MSTAATTLLAAAIVVTALDLVYVATLLGA